MTPDLKKKGKKRVHVELEKLVSLIEIKEKPIEKKKTPRAPVMKSRLMSQEKKSAKGKQSSKNIKC